MKKKIIRILLLSLFFTNYALPQTGAMDIFNTSHFARTIRLGNAYTGVAEGSEALFYNTAGIANQNVYSFLFSEGQGLGFFVDNLRAFDYALIVPFPTINGNVGISINTLSFDFGGTVENNVYGLHYARQLNQGLSVGIAASYYQILLSDVSVRSASSPEGEIKSVTGTAIDINLSTLYRLTEDFTFSPKDIFQLGFQIKNILNTKMNYDNLPQDDYKFQNIRLGLSYSFNPNLENIFNLSPLEFMLAFDAVFMGADYEFTEWQPNYGLELTILELLQLSFGRENEIQIEKTYTYTPQYPVNRYGFGITIPFQKFFDLSYNLELKLDYSISDWQKIDEENGRSAYIAIKEGVDNKAMSASLNFGF